METLQIGLEILIGILGGWLTLMMAYQLYLSAFGFGKCRKDYADREPESRFLVLIPAHNEERVIAGIIDNLNRMDYPKELYDFYVIADNCTDSTAQIARSMGAKVIETCKEAPDAPTGKPIALKKALEALPGYQERYDLMMIFDADNLMDTNMFREVNSQYLEKGKPDFIQCYLDSKNKDGFVAWFDYTSYTITNRFFKLAKYRLGLNGAICGTGFAMTTSYLYRRGGWTTVSLTEDFEIQVEAILEGRRILWNHHTRVYDEKPTKMSVSIRQKLRWGQGNWYVTLRNTKKVFGSLFAGKLPFREFLSLFTHMYNLSAYVVLLVQTLLRLILLLPCFEPGSLLVKLTSPDVQPSLAADIFSILPGLLIFTYSYFGLFYASEWLDNHEKPHLRDLPRMFISFAANLLVAAISQIVGLILCRQQQNWVKTEHTITAADSADRTIAG